MKRVMSLLLAALMVFSLAACGNQETKQAAETDEFLAQVQGSYIELFPELAKDEYHDVWVSYVEPIVGADATEDAIDMLLNMCTAEIYGDEAVAAYEGTGSMRFNCYFLGGVDQFTIEGNDISGVDADGKEVFSHTYAPIEDTNGTGFLFYKSEDANAGQFTYFAFAPDTPDETYHLEFRYSEDLDDLQSWFEGAYAYWNVGAIQTDYDDALMDKCIELFATENLSGE